MGGDFICRLQTLLEQLKCLLSNKRPSHFAVTTPTVGLNVSKCEINGILCQFWDMGGGGDLPKLWSKYYKQAHALLFLIDSLTADEEERVKKLKNILSNEHIQIK